MLAALNKEDPLLARRDISPSENCVEDELVTTSHFVNVGVIPDTGSITHDRYLAEFERCTNEDGNVAKFVQGAGADAVNGG